MLEHRWREGVRVDQQVEGRERGRDGGRFDRCREGKIRRERER